jgi:hypothetical protein
MRQIILSVSLILCALSISSTQCMWYAVDPEDQDTCLSSAHKGNLSQKYLVKVALHASLLDGDDEDRKVQEYCSEHGKRKKGEEKLVVACPDANCTSEITVYKKSDLEKRLKMHWYTTQMHQETYFQKANASIAQTISEAKRLFKQKQPFNVIPFPGNNNQAEGQEIENAQAAAIVQVPQLLPIRAPAQQVRYYLLEALPENPRIVATFIADSREKVLEAYLISKTVQGQLDDIEHLKAELVARTKKQRMVQGDVVRCLVCPAQGCEHQVTEAVQNAQEKLTQTLLVHYAAYHKQESPGIKKLVDLIAPSFDEAHKKIEKGEKHA